MVVVPIMERRQHPHAHWIFERRDDDPDDPRVMKYFEELGEESVRGQLEREGFCGRTAMANHWLKSKEPGALRFLRAIGLVRD